MPAPAADSSPPDDASALALASLGDASAFAALFHRHYPAIHAFAYRLALCASSADDIAQETFIQAARSLSTFRQEASFKNWLYTIATNRARDHLRQRARRHRLDAALTALSPEPDFTADPPELEPSSAAHAAVRSALARLSAPQREAIALVYFEHLNHADAARILGCAETTVSWRVFRARQHLKKHLSAPVPIGTLHHV